MDSYFFILLVFILSCVIHFLFVYFLFNLYRLEDDLSQLNHFPTEYTPKTKDLRNEKISNQFILGASGSKAISSNSDESAKVKLTILICARNEALNLEENIPLICEQSYPNLEVIVVNHMSTDNSQEVLSKLTEQYAVLKVVNCAEDNTSLPGKRSAVYAGLTQATGQYILLTDADCQPTSNQWAKQMVDRALSNNADVVLGIGAYENQSSLLNRFIQFETFQTALLYLSTALMKWPFMGVGRNLLVKKDVLEKRLKQSVVPGVLSGDDDLLIANLSFNHNVVIEVNEHARTLSIPRNNWASYLKQKMRHLSTSAYYRDQHRWLLKLFHGSQALILATFVILLISQYFLVAIIIMICRYVLLIIKLKREKEILKMKSNLLFYPILEFISLAVPTVAMIANRLIKSNEWS